MPFWNMAEFRLCLMIGLFCKVIAKSLACSYVEVLNYNQPCIYIEEHLDADVLYQKAVRFAHAAAMYYSRGSKTITLLNLFNLYHIIMTQLYSGLINDAIAANIWFHNCHVNSNK